MQIQESLPEGSTTVYNFNEVLPCLCFISHHNFQELCLLNTWNRKDVDSNANHVCKECCDQITFIDNLNYVFRETKMLYDFTQL